MGYTFFLFHYLPCSSVFGLRKAMDLLSGRYLVESVVFKSRDNGSIVSIHRWMDLPVVGAVGGHWAASLPGLPSQGSLPGFVISQAGE